MIEAISLGALVFTLSIRLAKLEKKCENEATVYKKCDGFGANCSNLLSTGKCKIIDLSEENILGSVKI